MKYKIDTPKKNNMKILYGSNSLLKTSNQNHTPECVPLQSATTAFHMSLLIV